MVVVAELYLYFFYHFQWRDANLTAAIFLYTVYDES